MMTLLHATLSQFEYQLYGLVNSYKLAQVEGMLFGRLQYKLYLFWQSKI